MNKFLITSSVVIATVIGLVLVSDFLSCPYYNPCREYISRNILFGFAMGALVFYYIGYFVGRNSK
jgi:hypothetical protein